MRIELNGAPIETGSRTLADFLDERGFEAEAVATAIDGTFVPRTARPNAELSEGVKIEILSPMQGG